MEVAFPDMCDFALVQLLLVTLFIFLQFRNLYYLNLYTFCAQLCNVFKITHETNQDFVLCHVDEPIDFWSLYFGKEGTWKKLGLLSSSLASKN